MHRHRQHPLMRQHFGVPMQSWVSRAISDFRTSDSLQPLKSYPFLRKSFFTRFSLKKFLSLFQFFSFALMNRIHCVSKLS
jgi:hypothetical protein